MGMYLMGVMGLITFIRLLPRALLVLLITPWAHYIFLKKTLSLSQTMHFLRQGCLLISAMAIMNIFELGKVGVEEERSHFSSRKISSSCSPTIGVCLRNVPQIRVKQ